MSRIKPSGFEVFLAGRGYVARAVMPFRLCLLCALLLWSGVATAQTEWTWQNPLPPQVNLNAIVHAGGKSLIVGDGGTILVSEDSKTWKVVPSGTNQSLYAAVYALGRWTAVGARGTVLQSEDGEEWVVRSAGTDQALRGISFANGRFVAVGGDYYSGTILSSVDGITWEVRRAGLDAPMNSVAYGNGTFVAVGENNRVYNSSDGENWMATSGSTNSNYMKGVTFGEGKFVACGSFGVIRTSTNGITWSTQVSGTSVTVNAITFSDGLFYGACAEGKVLVSDDAVTWTLMSAPVAYPTSLLGVGALNGRSTWVGSNGTILATTDRTSWDHQGGGESLSPKSVAYGNGIYVGLLGNYTFTATTPGQWTARNVGMSYIDIAFGAGMFVTCTPNTIRTSTDGITWTTRMTDAPYGASAHYTGNRFFVFGSASRLYTSANGINWQLVSLSGITAVKGVAYGNGVYVAVGNPNSVGEVRTSTNGTTWVLRSGAPAPGLTHVAFANGLFVATAINGEIYTSPDGVAWTARATGTAKRLLRVAWGGGTFVASGQTGTLLTSPNGITWTNRSMPTGGELWVTYGNSEFVAVGGRTVSSTDGVRWTFRSPLPSENFADVTFGHAGYAAVSYWDTSAGPSSIWHSPDGVTWTVQAIEERSLHGIGYANGIYFAGGDSGTLLTSTDGITWTKQVSNTTQPLRSFAHGKGTFVAVGGKWKGEVLSSPDGISWTSRATSELPRDLHAVTYVNGLFVAVGGDDYNGPRNFIATSPDGVNWTPRSIASQTSSQSPFKGVVYGNGTFVAAGDYGIIATSPNGTDWTLRIGARTGYQDSLTSLRFIGNRFIALRRYTGELMTSPDGLSWTPYPVPTSNMLASCLFEEERFLVVGANGAVLTSPRATLAPTPNPSLKALSSTQIQVSWPDLNGEHGYRLERKVEPEGAWIVIAADLPAGTTSFADSGLKSGARYSYRLRGIYSDEPSEFSTAVAGRTFTVGEQWRLDRFGFTEQSGDAADLADPDGDHIPNLLERAFVLDPLRAETKGMPVPFHYNYVRTAVLRFTRDSAQVDLVYEVESSDDLKTWTVVARSTNGERTQRVGENTARISDNPVSGTTKCIVDVGYDYYLTGIKKFLRVVVRRP